MRKRQPAIASELTVKLWSYESIEDSNHENEHGIGSPYCKLLCDEPIRAKIYKQKNKTVTAGMVSALVTEMIYIVRWRSACFIHLGGVLVDKDGGHYQVESITNWDGRNRWAFVTVCGVNCVNQKCKCRC